MFEKITPVMIYDVICGGSSSMSSMNKTPIFFLPKSQISPPPTTNHTNKQPKKYNKQTNNTTQEFAVLVKELVGGEAAAQSQVIHLPATKDDPAKRRPDITVAKKV